MKKNMVLCFVRDRISGVPETQCIQAMTDAHAIKGFIEFCKRDGVSPEEHELVKIAELNDENHICLIKNCPEIILCNGLTAEDTFKTLTFNLREDSDLEEANDR